jgi:hypothetical protein
MLRASFILSFLAFFSSCGPQGKRSEIKEFRLYLEKSNQPEKHKKVFRSLIDWYNQYAGFQALQFADVGEPANSAIVITKGLEEQDKKIGWGQSITETTTENPVLMPNGESQTVRYSMRTEFDADFTDRNSQDGEPTIELKTLFAHEVGHGLTMSHDPNRKSVMFESIGNDRDFDAYFKRVRDFFM